jgi:hypothetical protein
MRHAQASKEIHTIFLGKPEPNEALARPTRRRRVDDNIKMDLKEIGWKGEDWSDPAQDGEKRGKVSEP